MTDAPRITAEIGADNATFTAASAPSRGFLRSLIERAPELVRPDDWSRADAALCDAIAALRRLQEEEGCAVTFSDAAITADHRAVAGLNAAHARALGLPETVPFTFEVGTTGRIGQEGFRLSCTWTEGGQPVLTERTGAILKSARGTFRIPDPIYSALMLSEGFDASRLDVSDHWAALARFRQMLDSDNAPSPDAEPGPRDLIRMASHLQRMRIYPAASFSLALRQVADGIDFDPVLFSREAVDLARDGTGEISEADGLLPDDLSRVFQGDGITGFRNFDAAKPTYLLAEGQYLLLDPTLTASLNVVRAKQNAPAAERRAFAENPKAALAEALIDGDGTSDDLAAQEALEEQMDTVFQETIEFADRAIGIGLWEKPQFDFLPKKSNDWLPEQFPIRVDGKSYFVAPDEVEGLRDDIRTAQSEGREHVDVGGEAMPATDEALEELDKVRARIQSGPGTTPDDESAEASDPPPATQRIVLQVHENFLSNAWEPTRPDRGTDAAWTLPDTVMSTPLPHQTEGIDALIRAWRSPLPGFLQADDQGLGKTFQTLAFLAWLRQQQATASGASDGPAKGPVLVVAPTSLLRTWEREADQHLKQGTLGALLPVYGSRTKSLRLEAGKELSDGRPRLDLSTLADAIADGKGDRWWVLTTYETLANYQHSFHQIPFSVVIFDEIQKIKNPATINALAARSVQADFRIGLTGTPIENHIADLWAIMDAISPGRLVSMKAFAEAYGTITEASMRSLHEQLFLPQSGFPPLAIRRMKENSLEGLRRKDYRLYPLAMPPAQIEAYDSVREKLQNGARGSALKLLHHIRSVSLHHRSGRGFTGDPQDFIAGSARLATAFDLLDRLRESGDRALIFIEDRDMQYTIAEMIRARYGLDPVRIINGQTTIPRRQAHVEAFQRHLDNDQGFDVMILGPKAAGVGLTLTAATHVIHLSRWWNPAVEEQCNDRIYRIGQTRDVTIHMPMAVHPGYRERSFDCILNELMKRKRNLARAALWPPTDQDSDVEILMSGLTGSEPLDLAEIDGFDWQRFENWVLDRCAGTGEWDCYETRASGDGGADVVLRHKQRPETWAIVQVKHSGNPDGALGLSAVEDTLRARDTWNLPNPQLVVVTNRRDFDPAAMALARRENVHLVSRAHLSLWPRHVLA